MSLQNLKSIFQDELQQKTEDFISNVITNVEDSKLTEKPRPILDSVLRGREYEKIRFSQDFQNDNLFVKPETGEITEQLFKTQTFDPRAPFAKEGTLYFNTDKSFNPATNPTDFSTAIGNNDLPYTPLSQLGQSALDGLSWEKLYNREHTPLDNPSHKGVSAVNYGPNVNRDKLDIRDSDKKSSLYDLSRRTLAGLGEGEPYIISDIALSEGVHSGGRLLNQGSLFGVPINRMLTDTERITKFLSSAKGLSFIAAQNFLGENSKSIFLGKNGGLFSSSQRFKDTYNPLSTLLQTGFRAGFSPVTLVDKTEPNLGLDIFETNEYGTFLEAGPVRESTTVPYDLNKTFTDGSTDGGFNFSDFGNQLINTVKGTLGVPVQIKEKSSGGDKMTLANITKGNEILSAGLASLVVDENLSVVETLPNIEGEANGMPFYFKDLRDNAYIFFRAYIEGLTENISPSYNSTQYIGRSEPVYTYSMSEREISMTLKLFAQTKDELGKIYEKINKLTSLCYPEYFEDGGVSYGNRMKAPLTKLRIGEMFGNTNSELQGYIKSLNYSVENTSPYETETGKRVPKFVIVTIGYQVIHSTVPNLETKFYGYIGG